jgi:glycosyltransferase involved in cell wall biosynthesis
VRGDLLVLFDDREIAPALPRGPVTDNVDAATWPEEIRVIAAPGLGYYAQKNRGVDLAGAEWIVVLESDVIPEDGWLDGLARARYEALPAIGTVTEATI